MDQNERWELLARMNEEAPPRETRTSPKLGRTALAVAGFATLLFMLSVSAGLPVAARPSIVIVGATLSISLAVASLVRNERRVPAIVALCILVALPLVMYLVTILVWAGYSRGIGS
ncbi:MAG: hypothetical protein ACTH30_13520 [Leucobacter sp.]